MVLPIIFSIVGFLVLVLIILAIVISMRPDQFRVSRSASMAATPAAVFEQVNSFHKWENWSPWAKLDPKCKNTFEGPSAGVGATFRWAGDKNVGEGSMVITTARPNDLILIDLVFTSPMKAQNVTEFTFVPKDGATVVTWTMSGKNNFMGKAFGLVVDCDKMIGSKFEEGLESIRSIVKG